MDVDAALKALIEALENDDRDEASHYARAIADWLRRGGFMPTLNVHTFGFLMAELADYVHPSY